MTNPQPKVRGRGNWVVWAVYTQNGEKIGERPLRRFWTRRGARVHANVIDSSPTILAKSIETMLRGPAVFVDCEVRHG